jgi:hypothetical protein
MLDALHVAARSCGFHFMPLPDDIVAQLAADFAAEADPPPHKRSARRGAATSAIKVARKETPASDDLRRGPLLCPF